MPSDTPPFSSTSYACQKSVPPLHLHHSSAFARANAHSISRRGVFSVFFIKTRTTTTRRPLAVTYSTREIPLRPLSRISHSRPSICLTCGSPTCCRPTPSMSLAIRASLARISGGKASTSASTVLIQGLDARPLPSAQPWRLTGTRLSRSRSPVRIPMKGGQ